MAAARVREGELDFRGYRTWYRVTGAPPSGGSRLPVIVLHGGPGLAHNACRRMAGLVGDGRLVVEYDQLGCGLSTHLPDADPSFWTIELFKDELSNVVRSLDLENGFHLVGHSWGGMLGVEFALERPEGVASLTICNSPASMELWVRAAEQLRDELPAEIREALDRHEAVGTTDAEEYLAAVDFVYARHFCRVSPRPEEVAASLTQMESDPTVYHAMNGPNEFFVTGSLRGWSVVEQLPELSTPTLVVAGRYDEAAPITWEPFVEKIPDVRAHVFEESSHTPHIEEPEAFLAVAGEFLRKCDAAWPNATAPAT